MSSDERLNTLWTIWRARFIANGIDALDLERTFSAIDTWEDWAPAWAAAADIYETLARKELAAGHLVTAGQYLQRASLTVHFARVFEDPDNALHHRQVALYEEAAPLLRPPATRVDIETPVATVPGYLRFPPAVENPGLALLIPGLDSVKEQMGAWEPYFLDRGMATLSIEGPGQGECRYQPSPTGTMTIRPPCSESPSTCGASKAPTPTGSSSSAPAWGGTSP